jgi:hypothetical protein
MLRLRDLSLLLALCGCFMAALCVLVRFLVTGEMLVRRGGWATFADRPVGVALGVFAFSVMLVVTGVAAYLQFTGLKTTDRAFCALDRRKLLDAAQRQDRRGRSIEP